jgi:hypothetical protein
VQSGIRKVPFHLGRGWSEKHLILRDEIKYVFGKIYYTKRWLMFNL